MGCSGSKADDLPLVVRCRERRDLIRAAANHRYALAAAHVSYFRSLKDVGDALRKFVDEELITTSASSSSSFSSPSLILPPDSKAKHVNDDDVHLEDFDEEEDDDDSHIHLDSSSEEDTPHPHNVRKGFDDDDEKSRFRGHRQGFGAGMVNNEGESRYQGFRRGMMNDEDEFRYQGYRQGLGEGMVNDPFMYPYSNPYPQQAPQYGQQQYANPYPQQAPQYGQQQYANPYPQQAPQYDQQQYANPYPHQAPSYGQQYMDPYYYSNNSNVHYMKKSAPATRTVVQEPPVEPAYGYSDSYWTSPPGNGYFPTGNNGAVKVSPPKETPLPPSPKVSAWDFFNPFDELGGGYLGYYSGGGYGYGSNYSSPDSTEVREREGIPDLEEETENEIYKEVIKGKRMKDGMMSSAESTPRSRAPPARAPPAHRKVDGISKSVPQHKSESSSKTVPSWSSVESEKTSMPPQFDGEGSKHSMPLQHHEETGKPSMPPSYDQEGEVPSMSPLQGRGKSWVNQHLDEDMSGSIDLTDEKSSGEHIISTSVDEGSSKKKGVTFEVEGTSKQDGDSSKLSSFNLQSPNGTRDLREVVVEIKDEFDTASSYGKEVAMMLEVQKLPYQPGFLKVLISRMLYLVSPSLSLREPPSMQSAKLASKTMKMARSYFEEVGNDVSTKASNLSSVLDKLYAWEKKLYKEVKDEERLRVLYEKQCKRLKVLDEEGAESTKIDAAQASIRRSLTKLDVSIKTIDKISSRIHKLRDEELQPQVAALIQGLIRMWTAMLKCHRRQFHAIMESKMRKLKANTGTQTDSSSRATAKLERELRAWCERFNDWIRFQKSYVESLNGWLLQCLQYEPEETPDGSMPYSPARLGAPPIFVICNDWHQAMEAVSEGKVQYAMNTFATSLRQLWEKQDEEGRQRVRAEYLSKDYERQLKDRGNFGKLQDNTVSEKGGLPVVRSNGGVDDLKVDLDSMRQRLDEERGKHKDAMKLVHDAASSSLKGGLVPIFKALESFTSEALEAHEHVRLLHPSQQGL